MKSSEPSHFGIPTSQASREIDRTLLRWSLGLTPLERLRACSQATATLDRLRHASVHR